MNFVRIDAGYDRNGNPRRAYLLIGREGIVAAYKEGYEGFASVPERVRKAYGYMSNANIPNVDAKASYLQDVLQEFGKVDFRPSTEDQISRAKLLLFEQNYSAQFVDANFNKFGATEADQFLRIPVEMWLRDMSDQRISRLISTLEIIPQLRDKIDRDHIDDVIAKLCEGIASANRGELIDGAEVFRELGIGNL